MAPTDRDRSKARRLRKLRKAGTLDPAQKAWLLEYEATQKQTRAHERAPEGAPEGEPAAPTAPPAETSAGSSPIHKTAVVAAPEASSWAAVPMLPPGEAPPPEGSPGASLGGDGEHADQQDGDAPIADAPAAAGPTEDQITRGAARFAAMIVAVNALGIKAALELAPPEAIARADEALAEHLNSSISKLGAGALGIIHASAVNVARNHPILCASLPYEDEAVVLGSSAASLVALYLRHVRPRDEPAPAERPAPARAADAPKPNGTRPAPPGPVVVDFANLGGDAEADA